jgi:hypothetical protein
MSQVFEMVAHCRVSRILRRRPDLEQIGGQCGMPRQTELAFRSFLYTSAENLRRSIAAHWGIWFPIDFGWPILYKDMLKACFG